tara:strand:- start:497 stop:961 length:465 start_codon:yes stop_codon:yes gene_type:complete
MTKEPIAQHIREGFSKRLQQALDARNFPTKRRNHELQARYKSSQQAVNKWHHGTLPRIEVLCQICDDLNISLSWLVTGKGTMNDIATIDTEIFERVVSTTETLIDELGLQISAVARSKLYNRHYNILASTGELNTARIKEDLELLSAEYISKSS